MELNIGDAHFGSPPQMNVSILSYVSQAAHGWCEIMIWSSTLDRLPKISQPNGLRRALEIDVTG